MSTVLLVEDDAIIRGAIVRSLTKSEHVVPAARGLQADLGAVPTGELDATARAALLGPPAPPVGAR